MEFDKATNSSILTPVKRAPDPQPAAVEVLPAPAVEPSKPIVLPAPAPAAKPTRAKRTAKPLVEDDEPYVALWDRNLDPSDTRSSKEREREWIRNRDRANTPEYAAPRY